jgi:hypothetical protein
MITIVSIEGHQRIRFPLMANPSGRVSHFATDGRGKYDFDQGVTISRTGLPVVVSSPDSCRPNTSFGAAESPRGYLE